MPRSRSMSIVSRYWARMSRSLTAPHTSRMRSLSVVLPWSMCAMTLSERILERSMRVSAEGLRLGPRRSVHATDPPPDPANR